MASDSCPQLQIKDIYDIAQKVGEQFRGLLSQFGNTYLADHISTVVKALEYLETTFEEKQRLQVKNGKLMLDNDSLAREIRELSGTTKELRELQEKYRTTQRENKALTLKLEGLEARNSELTNKLEVMRKLIQSPATTLTRVEPQLTTAESHPLSNAAEDGHRDLQQQSPTLIRDPSLMPHLSNGQTLEDTDSSNIDILEVPRMHHRLHVVEKELQQARVQLTMMQKYKQELIQENHAQKLQLEEYRAEAALQSLEVSKVTTPTHKEGAPRYYKQDLLAVLRERNELKEEVDSLREELGMTKLELRKYQVRSPTQPPTERYRVQSIRKPRSQTRVREILDSFTNVTDESTTTLSQQQPPQNDELSN